MKVSEKSAVRYRAEDQHGKDVSEDEYILSPATVSLSSSADSQDSKTYFVQFSAWYQIKKVQ